MPKQLELACPARAHYGVLIKHADLKTGLRAARLISDAKRRAALILQQAEQQAADYRRHGYLQGYGEGILAGADAQVQALSDARRLTHGGGVNGIVCRDNTVNQAFNLGLLLGGDRFIMRKVETCVFCVDH